jgi:RimJ/RimL family protein N-acetyltransferase
MALTSKTFLRRAERDDLDTVVGWMEEPDFLQFLYGDATRSPKQIREQVVTLLGRASGQTMPGAIYLIIDSTEYGPIGLLSLQNISWRNRSCNVDLYIAQKKLRNRLVAAITFYRAMEYCFDELNLHRVTAFIYSFNEASWRIIEKIGAVREMTLREHVSRDGKLYDVYCYGLLRSEFQAFREKHFASASRLTATTVEDRQAAVALAGDTAEHVR